MGILTRIVKTGLTAGAAYAAVKVSQRYKENNPSGTGTDEEKKEAVKQAAAEVFQEAKQFYEEKAPAVQQTVSKAARVAADLAKTYAPGAVNTVRDAVQTVADKAQELADSLTGETYDAEFTIVKDDTPVDAASSVGESEAAEAAKVAEAADPSAEPLDPVRVHR